MPEIESIFPYSVWSPQNSRKTNAVVVVVLVSVVYSFSMHKKRHTNDICKSCTMRNHSLCIPWMKRRSSAHQVSFTHTPTSYFNSKANSDKKKRKQKQAKKNNKAPCNKHSSQLLQKKKRHIQVQKRK